jgi:hypothetical protein
MISINTRADLDALAGTPAHAAFLAALAGTIYRLEKDDAAQTWGAVQDTRTIESFGLTLADFPALVVPALPVYAPMQPTVPASVSMRQARLALAAAGLIGAVNAAIEAAGEAAKIEWEYSASVDRKWPLMAALQSALGLPEAQVDALFVAAAAL